MNIYVYVFLSLSNLSGMAGVHRAVCMCERAGRP